MDDKRFYKPREIITKNGGPLPIGLSTVYKLIDKGDIPIVLLGGIKLISSSFIQDLLNGGLGQ